MSSDRSDRSRGVALALAALVRTPPRGGRGEVAFDDREAMGAPPVAGGGREARVELDNRVVGMDIVEINPVLDQYNRTAELCVGLVTSAFGLRIL